MPTRPRDLARPKQRATIGIVRRSSRDWGGVRFSGNERERQFVFDAFVDEEVVWSAGLFVGEGHATVARYRRSSGTDATSARLALKMLDGVAVERFSAVFGLHFHCRPYKTDRVVFDVRAAGGAATAVLVALYPYMAGTLKGQQVAAVLREVSDEPEAKRFDVLGPIPPSGDFKRRPRTWLLDTTKFDQTAVRWASGLFAGEGYAGVQRRRKGERVFWYPVVSVSMLDSAAVELFAKTFGGGSFALAREGYSTGVIYRCHLNGSPAEAALRAMYPHLDGTDKAKQVAAVFAELELELQADGSGDTWPRSNGLAGRAMPQSHKDAIGQGQKRRWERQRDA